MANEYMKRCSTSSYKGNVIETTAMYYLTAVSPAMIDKTRNNKCWRECGEKRTFVHCWWEYKLRKTVWRRLKK